MMPGKDGGAARGPAARRALSRAVLLRTLRRDGPTTRRDLARRSGLSLTTVASLAAELEATGLVVQHPVAHGRNGRRPYLVAFNHAAGAALAIDIGPRHVAAAVGNRAQPLVAEHRIDGVSLHHPQAVEQLVVTCAERALAEARVDAATLLGAAVALTGAVSPRRNSRPVPGRPTRLRPADVARAVRRRWQIPVTVESRARMGVIAEFAQGDAQGAHTLVNLTLDDRIDLGIAIDGTLLHGRTGRAGGIGHLVVHPGGRLCRCGQRGCLDTYVDGVSLGRALEPTRVPSPEAAVDAVSLLAQAAAVATLLLDPSAVVLGGSLAALGSALAESLRAGLGAALPLGAAPPVLCSTLGDRAPLLGGLSLVLSAARPALRTPPPGAGREV